MAYNDSRSGRRWGNDGGGDSQRDRQALALKTEAQPPRLPMPAPDAAAELDITRPMWKLLTDTVYPAAKTVDGVMQAVAYCKVRGFDVMKRPVHVVPMYNSALQREVETVWPGIGELRTTAARTNQWAGTDDVVFGPSKTKAFAEKQSRKGRDGKPDYVKEESCPEVEFPLWAQVTVKKIVQGQIVSFVGPKVFWLESFAGIAGMAVPNAMWRKRPIGQLEKCAEAAALRRAFPEEIGDQYAAEEMEGKEWVGHNGGPALDAEETAATGGQAAPTRASSAAADEKRALDERLVRLTRKGLATAVASSVDKTFAADRAQIEAMDEDLNTTIMGLYDDARRRLGIDVPLTDEDVAGYKADFRTKLRAATTAALLDAFLRVEADNLDALPEAAQTELEVDIDEHRENIAAVSQGSDAGDGPPPADDEVPGAGEEA